VTDRELLELAAKATGINIKMDQIDADDKFIGFIVGARNTRQKFTWNPLDDDGDALRLAVRRGIEVRNFNGKSHAGRQGHFWCTEDWFPDGDQYAATRRAIVRAAAKDEGEAKSVDKL